MKNLGLLAMGLLILALAGGCAKGGNGEGSGIVVTISGNSPSHVYPGQTTTYTATVTPAGTNQAVIWSLMGSQCTGTPNACGTLDSSTGAYVAPAAPPSPATFEIVATSVADNTAFGTYDVSVQLISVVVTPTAVTMGENLVQQFTATATPDAAPQTFTWSLTCGAAPCGQLTPGANNAGTAVYTAPASSQTVSVSATSTVNDGNLASFTSKVTVATSRLSPSSTYGFQFSGYDTSNNPVAAVGTITTSATSTIASGVEEVLTASGAQAWTVDAGSSYVPSSNNDSSNNLGTLTLNLSSGTTTITNTYTAVLTSSGNIQMIESDGEGTGYGAMQKSTAGQFGNGSQSFAFGFSGVDSSLQRAGYAGLLTMIPTSNSGGNISSGMLDANDNGTASKVSTITGTYQQDTTFPGLWHMTLSTGQDFDFVVGGGTLQAKTGSSPLTLYAISSDALDSTHPAISGSMTYQVPMPSGYTNAAFCPSANSGCTSISVLTGANANVALINGTTDGTSSGTGGSGGFTGNFDQNNNGTILSVSAFPSAAQTPSPYTYVASGTSGRYVFQMMGNPNATPATLPIPFVLYASGANRGYLLDQASTAVMTGAMNPQPTKASGAYAPAELPGTYAAGTASSSSGVAPSVENLLLTSPGGGVFNVTGTENQDETVTGTYSIQFTGTGAITLTAPTASTNVIYAIDFDSTNSVILDFFMMGTTSGTPSALLFAQQ